MALPRRHILSVDDGPFRKFSDPDVLVVGVVTAGKDLIEGVLTTRLPVDGEDAAGRLASWIGASRFRRALRAIILDGITLAGLSVVDLPELARLLGLPAIAVNRRLPGSEDLKEALRAAGLQDRIPLIERAGFPERHGRILFRCAGVEPREAREILEAETGKSSLPEGIRLAHLIAQGIVLGESRGRP